jgi:hypothetical protein
VPNWRDYLDLLGQLRYGMPTSEKEALAAKGSLLGAPVGASAEQDRGNRYAAGYPFGKQSPRLAPTVQGRVDRIKTSDLPLLGGSSPELQSYASEGVARGAAAGDVGDELRRIRQMRDMDEMLKEEGL